MNQSKIDEFPASNNSQPLSYMCPNRLESGSIPQDTGAVYDFAPLGMGFIFQTFLLIDSLTAVQNIELVLKFAGADKKSIRKRANDLLKQFEIEELADKLSVSLSQGEKQRVAVARAIANDADLILADEPTASLETNQGMQIIELLHNYARQRSKCVIAATHDLRLKDYADRIIYLRDGEIIK